MYSLLQDPISGVTVISLYWDILCKCYKLKFINVLLTLLQNRKSKINNPVGLLYGEDFLLLLEWCPMVLFLHGIRSQ